MVLVQVCVMRCLRRSIYLVGMLLCLVIVLATLDVASLALMLRVVKRVDSRVITVPVCLLPLVWTVCVAVDVVLDPVPKGVTFPL